VDYIFLTVTVNANDKGVAASVFVLADSWFVFAHFPIPYLSGCFIAPM
jgi:hypothetical protein